MSKITYDIPVVFFVEVEYDDTEDAEVHDYLKERAKIEKVLAEELGFCIGEFDFIMDSISEKVFGIVNSIRVQKTK